MSEFVEMFNLFLIKSLTGMTVILMLIVGFSISIEAENRIYWADAQTRKIQRANLDGTSLEDVINTGPFPIGLDLDVAGGKIYWSEVGPNLIRRANFDGTAIEDLVGSVGSRTIALDLSNGRMYWADSFVASKIQRANLDGTDVEDLVTFGDDRAGIALDVPGGKMYWTVRTSSRQKIQRANLDGTGIEDLVIGLIDPRQIALDLDDGKMYWADAQTHKIQRANLDGTLVEDLVTGLVNPHGIALDILDGKMYWSDFGTDKVQRANLNGSELEDIVVELGNPVEIALELDSLDLIVDIDIKPGDNDINCINPNSNGNVPVAILGNSVDVFDIDLTTVEIDKDDDTDAIGVTPVKSSIEDVNGDFIDDLVMHFNTSDLDAEQLLTDGNELFITGELSDGTPILGSDFVFLAGGPSCFD
jgi:sugar lactone lactonase YvrE